jgi:hypothetical protein
VKTLVKSAVDVASNPGDADPQLSLTAAISALDRAAKTGAIHPNAAARRKSRLAIKVNDLLAGTSVVARGKAKQVGKAAAQKAAKQRIAAGKAGKAKGAQTAAGKARAALSKTTRAEAAAEAAAKPAVSKATTSKAATSKAAAKPAAKAPTKPASTKK